MTSEFEALQFRKQILKDFFTDGDPLIWDSPSRQLIVFGSSTFTDTVPERNLLIEKILPQIREKSRPLGIEVSLVDMRWGVRDENTDDHQTWVACCSEIQRCRKSSGGLFFMSLQSEKYGYCPLPIYMEQDAYEERLVTLSEDVKTLADRWYHLDENHIPPRYVLQRLDDQNRNEYWSSTLKTLVPAFAGIEIHARENCRGLILGHCVTEWEVRYAFKEDRDLHRCAWIHRAFENGVIADLDPKRLFCDVRDDKKLENNLRELKDFMVDRLCHPQSVAAVQPGQLVNLEVPFASYHRRFEQKQEDKVAQSYIAAWQLHVEHLFSQEVDKLAALHKRWLVDGDGVGIPGQLLQDILHHYSWARAKCETFIGRENLLQDIQSAIDAKPSSQQSSTSSALDSISLCIIGRSGTGKTALVAMAAIKVASSKLEKRPILVRFCGTSADSASGLALLRSLNTQLTFLFGELTDDEPIALQQELEGEQEQQQAEKLAAADTAAPKDEGYLKEVRIFQRFLTKYAVLLFLDSLDQLSNANLARSRISFLRDFQPHPQTRIIVSALPDERDESTGQWIYSYGCDSQLSMNNVSRLVVPFISDATSSSTAGENQMENFAQSINSLLKQRDRCLSNRQIASLSDQVLLEPSALYATMVARNLSKLTSYGEQTFVLPKTVRELLNQLFADLEREFGLVFTSSALALLTFSVHGLTDLEMEDLITMDDIVLNNIFQYFTPNRRRFPTHVWLRLKAALSGLITERQDGCSVWYHRQLREAAGERYGTLNPELRTRCCLLMAQYFGNLVPVAQAEDGLIKRQPLTLNGLEVWHVDAFVNHRRLGEAARHMLSASLIVEAITETCTLAAACSYFRAGFGYELVTLLGELNRLAQQDDDSESKSLMLDDDQRRRVQHYYRWLRKVAGRLNLFSREQLSDELFVSASQENLQSIVRTDAARLFEEGNVEGMVWTSTSLGGAEDFSSLLVSVHCPGVLAVDYSSALELLAVSSDIDSSVKLCSAENGEVKVEMPHTETVTKLLFSPNGRFLATLSPKTTMLWDTIVGAPMMRYDFSDTVEAKTVCLSWSEDNQFFAVDDGCDGHLYIFQVTRGQGELFRKISFDQEQIRSHAFHPIDSNLIAVASVQNPTMNLKIWDIQGDRPTFNKSFEADEGNISCLSFSHDGKRLASVIQNGVIDSRTISPRGLMVIDVEYEDTVFIIEGIADVRVLSFVEDGQRIAIVCKNSSTMIFNALTGAEIESAFYEHREAAISRSNRRLAIAQTDAVHLYDLSSMGQDDWFLGHKDAIQFVAVSGDGLTIASATNHEIIIWKRDSGEMVNIFSYISKILSISLDRDGGQVIVLSEEEGGFVWATRDGILLHTLAMGLPSTNAVKLYPASPIFTNDGQFLLYIDHKNAIRYWQMGVESFHRAKSWQLKNDQHVVQLLPFKEGDRMAVLLQSGEVIVWNNLDEDKRVCFEPIRTTTSQVQTIISWTDDGKAVACFLYDESERIATLKLHYSSEEHSISPTQTLQAGIIFATSLQFSPYTFALCDDGMTMLIGDDDVEMKRMLTDLGPRREGRFAVAITSDDQFLVYGTARNAVSIRRLQRKEADFGEEIVASATDDKKPSMDSVVVPAMTETNQNELAMTVRDVMLELNPVEQESGLPLGYYDSIQAVVPFGSESANPLNFSEAQLSQISSYETQGMVVALLHWSNNTWHLNIYPSEAINQRRAINLVIYNPVKTFLGSHVPSDEESNKLLVDIIFNLLQLKHMQKALFLLDKAWSKNWLAKDTRMQYDPNKKQIMMQLSLLQLLTWLDPKRRTHVDTMFTLFCHCSVDVSRFTCPALGIFKPRMMRDLRLQRHWQCPEEKVKQVKEASSVKDDSNKEEKARGELTALQRFRDQHFLVFIVELISGRKNSKDYSSEEPMKRMLITEVGTRRLHRSCVHLVTPENIGFSGEREMEESVRAFFFARDSSWARALWRLNHSTLGFPARNAFFGMLREEVGAHNVDRVLELMDLQWSLNASIGETLSLVCKLVEYCNSPYLHLQRTALMQETKQRQLANHAARDDWRNVVIAIKRSRLGHPPDRNQINLLEPRQEGKENDELTISLEDMFSEISYGEEFQSWHRTGRKHNLSAQGISLAIIDRTTMLFPFLAFAKQMHQQSIARRQGPIDLLQPFPPATTATTDQEESWEQILEDIGGCPMWHGPGVRRHDVCTMGLDIASIQAMPFPHPKHSKQPNGNSAMSPISQMASRRSLLLRPRYEMDILEEARSMLADANTFFSPPEGWEDGRRWMKMRTPLSEETKLMLADDMQNVLDQVKTICAEKVVKKLCSMDEAVRICRREIDCCRARNALQATMDTEISPYVDPEPINALPEVLPHELIYRPSLNEASEWELQPDRVLCITLFNNLTMKLPDWRRYSFRNWDKFLVTMPGKLKSFARDVSKFNEQLILPRKDIAEVIGILTSLSSESKEDLCQRNLQSLCSLFEQLQVLGPIGLPCMKSVRDLELEKELDQVMKEKVTTSCESPPYLHSIDSLPQGKKMKKKALSLVARLWRSNIKTGHHMGLQQAEKYMHCITSFQAQMMITNLQEIDQMATLNGGKGHVERNMVAYDWRLHNLALTKSHTFMLHKPYVPLSAMTENDYFDKSPTEHEKIRKQESKSRKRLKSEEKKLTAIITNKNVWTKRDGPPAYLSYRNPELKMTAANLVARLQKIAKGKMDDSTAEKYLRCVISFQMQMSDFNQPELDLMGCADVNDWTSYSQRLEISRSLSAVQAAGQWRLHELRLASTSKEYHAIKHEPVWLRVQQGSNKNTKRLNQALVTSPKYGVLKQTFVRRVEKLQLINRCMDELSNVVARNDNKESKLEEIIKRLEGVHFSTPPVSFSPSVSSAQAYRIFPVATTDEQRRQHERIIREYIAIAIGMVKGSGHHTESQREVKKKYLQNMKADIVERNKRMAQFESAETSALV